jgi:hypothetical protein
MCHNPLPDGPDPVLTRFVIVREFLRRRGADRVSHPGGNLYDHLVRVADLLSGWGADEDVTIAGMCHACYGTGGFDVALARVDERDRVAAVLGKRAEALVYLYGSCDRRAVYPGLVGQAPAPFRDRFTGETCDVGETDLRAFLEITAANELDVLVRQPELLDRHGHTLFDLFDLFDRCRGLLSPPAWQVCLSVLGQSATGGGR